MARNLLHPEDPLGAAAGLLAAALDGFDRPRLAVSGGSAAAVLGRLRRAMGPRWRQVRLTWVDERRVPFLDPASNRGEAYRLGDLDEGDRPGLELALFLDGETGAGACRRVAAALEQDFGAGLDVLLLGLGEDGHSASLFPGRPWPRARVHLVEHSPKPPPARITLGLDLLAAAPVAVLVALGAAKAPALRRLLRGDPALPASALANLTVMTDLDLGEDHG